MWHVVKSHRTSHIFFWGGEFLYNCIFSFLKKRPPYGKSFKILLRTDSLWHRSTCCVQISSNLADRKSVKSWVAHLTKNFPGSPAVVTARIAPETCQGQPRTMYPECPRFHPKRFTFGGVILERVNTTKTGCKVFPVFGWSLASSRIQMLLSMEWMVYLSYVSTMRMFT